jgi:FAD/FMN-containing dehydrogenase
VSSLTALLADLAGISVSTDSEYVRRASRDMSAVLSPTLAAGFADRQASAVVSPADDTELTHVLAACARHRVPVVARGAGTCNFGQGIPLRGGVILDLRALAGMVWVKPGSWRAKTGTILADADAALAASGQELRVFPSSKAVGTIGGYINGGHAGIGAIRHGVLADRGNILGLQVLTMEETPRLLELRGADVDLVHFSFGTAGIVTEVEMPAAQLVPWRDVVFTFERFADAVAFALAGLLADGLDLKNIHPVDSAMARHFSPLELPAGRAAALCMVAPQSLEGLRALANDHGGRLDVDVATGEGPRGIPLYEYTWGHATWWVRKAVPTLATLVALLPEDDPIDTLIALRKQLGEPLWLGVSCKRFAGRPALQLMLGIDSAEPHRLADASSVATELGCLVADTHRPVLGATSFYASNDRQRTFRAEVDPHGLLNPGTHEDDADERDATLSGTLSASGFTARRS